MRLSRRIILSLTLNFLVLSLPIFRSFAIASSSSVLCSQALSSDSGTNTNINIQKQLEEAQESSKHEPKGPEVKLQIIESFLTKFPNYLTAEQPPAGPLLTKINKGIENPYLFIKGSTIKDEKGRNAIPPFLEQSRQQMKTFLERNFKFEGHYYFFGNGMEPFREITKNILAGTSAEKRIHELRVSRLLIETQNFKENIYKYFESLQWGPDFPGNIVLIDSVFTRGREGSLITITDLTVEFLVNKGMSKEDAVQKVVPIAITEAGSLGGNYTVDSNSSNLEQDYFKEANKFAKNKRNHLEKSRPFIFDDSLSNNILTIAFRYVPKWHMSYKYREFDDNGLPMPNMKAHRSIWDKDLYNQNYLSAQIRERISYLAFYKIISDYFKNAIKEPEYQSLIRKLNEQMLGPDQGYF